MRYYKSLGENLTEVYRVPALVLDYDMYHSFWELLSILTFPIDKQIAAIGGMPTTRLSQQPYITNALLFKEALDSYSKVWLEAFDELYDIRTQSPIPLYHEFRQILQGMDETDCYSISEFNNGHWQRLRQLSPQILDHVGLPIMGFDDIAKPTDWDRLVRVFINAQGDIQVD